MSDGLTHDEQTLEDGEIPPTPGTAAAVDALLHVQNAAAGQEGNGNHEPGTGNGAALAAAGGQGDESRNSTPVGPTPSTGVTGTTPASVVEERPLLSTNHTYANTLFQSQGGTRVPIYSPNFASGLGAGATQPRGAIPAPMQGIRFRNQEISASEILKANGYGYDARRGGWFMPTQRPSAFGGGSGNPSPPTSGGSFPSPPLVPRYGFTQTSQAQAPVDTIFSESQKQFDSVNGVALRDEERTATDRHKAFARITQKYTSSMDVRLWVETFKRVSKLSGLSNNPKLILQTLLDKVNAETNVGRGVHAKYDTLQTERFQQRLRTNGHDQGEALAFSLGTEAMESYVNQLLDHVMVARAAKLNETHLDDKWHALKLKPRQSLQGYFAKVETLCTQIRAIGGHKTPEEQIKALLNGLPQSTKARSGDFQVSLPGEARKEIERAKNAHSQEYLAGPLAYVQRFLQNQVTNFKLKLRVSEDDSDDESEEEEPETKVRYTSTDSKKVLGDRKTLKDEAALKKLADKIPQGQLHVRPCYLCTKLIPGRARFGANHSAGECWQNPNSAHFEPKVGVDRHGKERKSRRKQKDKRKERESKKGDEPNSKRQAGGEDKAVRFTKSEWEAQAKEAAKKKAAEFSESMKAWTQNSESLIVPKREYEQLQAMRRTILSQEAQKTSSTSGTYGIDSWVPLSKSG